MNAGVRSASSTFGAILRMRRASPAGRRGWARTPRVNRRGRGWRWLPEAQRPADRDGLNALLVEQPALLERRVIEAADGTVHVGWTDAVRASLARA